MTHRWHLEHPSWATVRVSALEWGGVACWAALVGMAVFVLMSEQ